MSIVRTTLMYVLNESVPECSGFGFSGSLWIVWITQSDNVEWEHQFNTNGFLYFYTGFA